MKKHPTETPSGGAAAPPNGRQTATASRGISAVAFDDLLDIRVGDAGLTLGSIPSRIEKIASAEQWAIKAAALRDLFRQTLGEMPPVACGLAPEQLGEEDRGDHIRRRVAYAVAPDERISAYLLLPKRRQKKAPAVLCIHPTTPLGKEQSIGNDPAEGGQDRAYALHLVRRGYVTLSYDLISANERCYPGLRPFDTAPFYQKHPRWSVRGKDLWDARRAVDFLTTLDEVDPERIGSIGHSQGGGITIHAMGLDERIKVGVSSCGMWPDRLSKNPFNNARTGWWVGRPLLRPYCWTGKDFPVGLHEHLAMIAPRAVMAITALNDCGYAGEEAEAVRPVFANLDANVTRVFELLGAAGSFRSVLHTRGHSFFEEQRAAAYAFLDEHLKP